MELREQSGAPPGSSFAELVYSHRTRLLRFALRRLGDHEAVEDLVADTFTVAWRHWDDRPPSGQELFWLYGIARMNLLNLRRGQWRRLALGQRLAAERVLPPGEFSSGEDREALQLTYWEGLTQREIGLVLGCSENAVALRMSRARRALREHLTASRPVPMEGTQ
jgi:DNA-directed RNA polymerase specialized sigma24 family protein